MRFYSFQKQISDSLQKGKKKIVMHLPALAGKTNLMNAMISYKMFTSGHKVGILQSTTRESGHWLVTHDSAIRFITKFDHQQVRQKRHEQLGTDIAAIPGATISGAPSSKKTVRLFSTICINRAGRRDKSIHPAPACVYDTQALTGLCLRGAG